jgi:lipoprotein-anchoring transpeptidase ErfK/SrfK
MQYLRVFSLLLLLSFLLPSCAKNIDDDSELSENERATTTRTPARQNTKANITFPVLDAYFADSSFKSELAREAELSDEEVLKLQQLARQEIANLKEAGTEEYSGTTQAAQQLARDKMTAAIGKEKTDRVISFVHSRWNSNESVAIGGGADSNSPAGKLNQVPTDTRIIVNAPAYRMDIFDSGRLVRTYNIAIGYPEFPLPAGMRKAGEIIFNPSWTPPDELWVDTSSKYKAGKRVEPGSKLNPLGIAKIPIGGPSLIHGGKNDAQLGSFGSHGCVGLTNKQMQMFAKEIARLGGGDSLSDKRLSEITKNKKESQSVKLTKTLPVELRYETILIENGEVHIYRDVYDRGTNSQEHLRTLLQQYGLTFDNLSDTERTQLREALVAMVSRSDSLTRGMTTADSTRRDSTKALTKPSGSTASNTTKTRAREKVRIVPVAALQGKGYPAPILEGRTMTGSTATTTKKK